MKRVIALCALLVTCTVGTACSQYIPPVQGAPQGPNQPHDHPDASTLPCRFDKVGPPTNC